MSVSFRRMRYTGCCCQHQGVPGQAAPGRNVGRRARVERDQAQHPPRRHAPAAGCAARARARRSRDRRRPTRHRRRARAPAGSRRAPLVDLLDRARTSSCAVGASSHDAAGAQGQDAIGVGAGQVHLVEAGHDGHAGAHRGAERLPARWRRTRDRGSPPARRPGSRARSARARGRSPLAAAGRPRAGRRVPPPCRGARPCRGSERELAIGAGEAPEQHAPRGHVARADRPARSRAR